MLHRLWGIAGGVALLVTASQACAVTVDCTTNQQALFTELQGLSVGAQTISVHSTSGSPCLGDSTSSDDTYGTLPIYWNGTTIINADSAGDYIQGEIVVLAIHTFIKGTGSSATKGLIIEGTSTNPANTVANIYVTDSANVSIDNVVVESGYENGILVTRGGTALLTRSTIGGASSALGNGQANVTGENAGILVASGGTIRVGNTLGGTATPDPSMAVTIENNAGPGIEVISGGTAQVYSSTIANNGTSTGGPEIQVEGHSGIHLEGISGGGSNATTVTATSGDSFPAIFAEGGSSVGLYYANVTGGGKGALLVAGNSVAFLYGSNVSDSASGANCGNPKPVVEAVGSSSVFLAGGNTVQSTGGGFALSVQNASTLYQGGATSLLPGLSALYPNATDTITGNGCIKTYSNMELGATNDASSGLLWNGTGLVVTVQQTSLARLDGNNVTISGELLLDQGADGYFNQNNWLGSGTANSISSVVCNNVESRITNPTEVSPSISLGSPPSCTIF